MKKATQKEFETIQEVFEINAVKAMFKHLLKEKLITLIKGLDQRINK